MTSHPRQSEPVVVFDVVVPTTARPALGRMLHALAAGDGPRPRALIVVDDRREPDPDAVAALIPSGLAERVAVLPGGGRGPAAARNAGRRAARAPWIAFLDDDVLPPPGWRAALAARPGRAGAVGGRQPGADPRAAARGPAPDGLGAQRRRPRDGALGDGRHGLPGRARCDAVGGFDERFPRAYREDADLALRLREAGFALVVGAREVEHPVPPADRWVSVRKQAGNADDVLMGALHGRGWRERARRPAGALPRAPRHRGPRRRRARGCRRRGGAAASTALAGAWACATARLRGRADRARAARRRRGRDDGRHERAHPARRGRATAGPRAARAGAPCSPITAARRARCRRPPPCCSTATARSSSTSPTTATRRACGRCPARAPALDRLRAAGVRLAVVSNQSGIARGLLTEDEVDAVNRRVEELLGPLGPWLVCPHGPDDGCRCRKPAPGLVLDAAAQLGVDPSRCAVVGDIGADVEAAQAAGARAVLVPTPRTPPRGGRRRARSAPATSRRPSSCCWGRARERATSSSPGSTTTATCCSPGPPSGRSPPAARRVTLLCGPRGRRPARAAARRRRGRRARPAEWIDPEPPPVDARRRSTRSSTGSPRSDADEAIVLTLVPPEPAAARAAAADGRRPAHRGDERRLPRLAARRPPPHRRRRARGRARPCRSWPRSASRCPPATTAPCASRAPGRAAARRRATSSCTRAPRCPRARGRPSAMPPLVAALAADGAPRGRHRRARRARADRVSSPATTREDLGGPPTSRGLADVLAARRLRRRRQHRPGAPRRRRRARRSSRSSPRPCPRVRWRPWRVPHVLLYRSTCRARAAARATCPVPGHPCLGGVARGRRRRRGRRASPPRRAEVAA